MGCHAIVCKFQRVFVFVVLQATGQSKVLKSVVRPEGWDDERLKLEVPRPQKER